MHIDWTYLEKLVFEIDTLCQLKRIDSRKMLSAVRALRQAMDEEKAMAERILDWTAALKQRLIKHGTENE